MPLSPPLSGAREANRIIRLICIIWVMVAIPSTRFSLAIQLT